MSNVLERYELFEKDVTFTTDAGPNICAGVHKLDKRHHKCIGHGIHKLVSKDGIAKTPELKDFCTKARTVCRTVRYRLPELERESFQAANVEWMQSVANVENILDVDDMDPVLDSDVFHQNVTVEVSGGVHAAIAPLGRIRSQGSHPEASNTYSLAYCLNDDREYGRK